MRALDLSTSPTHGETDAPDCVFSHDSRAISAILLGRVGQVHLSLQTIREGNGSIEERLLAYLQCADEPTSQDHLTYLLDEVAKPIIQRIVQRSSRLDPLQAEYETSPQDLAGEALVRVLKRLRASKADPNQQLISNFPGLVATITYRAIAENVRARNRQWANLEKKIRRLFAANGELDIWKDSERNLVCGYQVWHGSELSPSDRTQNPYATQSELSSIAEEFRFDNRKRNTAELILILLDKVRRPIKLRDLVDLINGLRSSGPSSLEEINPSQEFLTDNEGSLAAGVVKTRRLLERLFAEIHKLGIEQRKSLLLNMTDSYGFSIEWFMFTGIATEAQLARLLEVSTDEFKLLLNHLPMTDKEIANQLGMSPTKVANIRKAVRERLARCRQAFLRENESEL